MRWIFFYNFLKQGFIFEADVFLRFFSLCFVGTVFEKFLHNSFLSFFLLIFYLNNIDFNKVTNLQTSLQKRGFSFWNFLKVKKLRRMQRFNSSSSSSKTCNDKLFEFPFGICLQFAIYCRSL